MRSSQAAMNLIVAEEVSSKAVYEKRYQHPEWPGGQSGVTIGIGYDLGFATPQRVQDDWGTFLSPPMIRALQSVCGKTGAAAQAVLRSVRNTVVVPWDAAMHVFEKIDMPKWESIVLRACPGSEKLPPDCFGVITSIAYNRGASFSKKHDPERDPHDRYREMRNIRALIARGEFDKVPAQIIAMKRLWGPNQQGLLNRRDHEAALYKKGLTKQAVPLPEPKPKVTQPGNAPAKIDDAEKPINVQPTKVKYDPLVETVQRRLRQMNYHEVGDIDGLWGGKTRGAITAFMNDRGDEPTDGTITREFLNELAKAMDEGWSRPIAPSRANATEAEVAKKVPAVNQAWYTKFLAYIAGIPAFLAAAFKSVFGEQSDAAGYISSVKNFFGQVPTEYYWLAVAGVALVIVVQATRAQNAAVKAYQRGEIN